MFFGSSRISFVKNLLSLIGDPTNNNYIITFIDEATVDYTSIGGSQVGPYWENDVEYFLSAMEGRNPNSYIVFDIESSSVSNPGIDYIWPSNNNAAARPPFPLENIIEIFRPNENTQQEFYDIVITNLESRWGSDIWNFLVENNQKLLIVVDVSGSMNQDLIQGSLDLLTNYLTEKNVEYYILNGCRNERWLAWGAAAYIDGPSAGCSAACNWGLKCVYTCDSGGEICETSVCIPPYVFQNGQVTQNQCEESCTAQELPTWPGHYVDEVICYGYTVPGGVVGGICVENDCQLKNYINDECECPRYDGFCNICSGLTGWDHKCVQCYYYEENFWNPNDPFPDPFPSIDLNLTICQMAPCSLTQGSYLGESITSNTDFGSSRYIGWTGGTGNFWDCSSYTEYTDDFGNCIPCPLLHPQSQSPLAKIVVCGYDENGGFTGCTGCGLSYGFDYYYDVCGVTC